MVNHNDKIIRLLLWCLSAVCGFYSYPVQAQGCPQDQAVARVVSTQGRVALNQNAAGRGDLLCPGDIVRVGPFSRAALIMLATETTVRIDQESVLRLPRPAQREQSLLDLIKGALYLFSREPPALDIYTPYVNAAVEGTEFLVRAAEDRSFITVFEGRILASNAQGEVRIGSNQTAVAGAGEAPRLIETIRPQDAVQWALYYQPILAALYTPESAPEPLRQALGKLDYRNPAAVIERLDQIPPAAQDDFYQVFRAAWLLAVGQSQAAQALLDAVLQAQPDNGNAQALAAIIAVTQNDKTQALVLAQQAVKSSSQSAAAWLALSYAQQAQFDLDGALASTQAASERDPGNALVRARLSELWLSKGELDQALSAAQQAAERNPNIGRTQSVLGFAYLTRIDIEQARQAFERAIELDQADPQPRLGLGLAKIRQGELEPGREELAIAVSLDPLNSLLRSYLGKAYFEEKRAPLASTQYEIAKDLDRLDPTPWLYDALLKQAENRPVEALQDIQKSIELNDNRAVYRSRLLLDEDEAVRGTSLARIYDDLGFEQQALSEGTKSLSIDPGNHSAHRFLSDAYTSQPRHEIARVSELLQAQLLQPVNINPVQPQALETDLNIIARGGPARIGFNEFTPLFERNDYQVNLSALAGNHGTWGDEFVFSGIAGHVSYSLGQYHYESDGFRVNNDLQHDIYNAFIQAQIAPDLSLQFEYRRRETEQGDLRINFDPDDFSKDIRRLVEQDTARFGMRYTLSPRSSLLASLIYADGEATIKGEIGDGISQSTISGIEGYDAQIQYIHKTDYASLIAGGGIYDIDNEETDTLDFTGLAGVPCPSFPPFSFESCDEVTKSPIKQRNAYFYSHFNRLDKMVWTLGLAYDDFEQEAIQVDSFSPKIGLLWDLNDNVTVRAAYFQSLKRALVADQTIEPTQVAGFNQFYDDFNGTESTRYGIGLDAAITSQLFAGAELSWRNLDIPRSVSFQGAPPELSFFEIEERAHRLYLNWTPSDHWALSAEARYEQFEREDSLESNLPDQVITTSFPLRLRYFNPSGWFGEIGATFVVQDVHLSPASEFSENRDDFFLLDLTAGYRFPNRQGQISLALINVLGQEFLYQDVNIQRPIASNPQYVPERTVLLNAVLNF